MAAILPSTAVGATLVGSEVTLVFTSKNRSGFAIANMNGNVTIDLRPPKTGPLAGIVTFGDRGMPTGTSFKFKWRCYAASWRRGLSAQGSH